MLSLQIETIRLIMRPPVEADLDGWAAFDCDERANEFFGGTKSRAASWELLASAAGMWALRGCGLFSVIEKSSGQWIGRIGPWKPEGATAEIGWAVLSPKWGQGYATEGARAAIDWSINELGWTQINHCIDAENSASIAVAQRLGSKWLRTDYDAHGKVTQVYGQSAHNWKSQRS
jgi:RimJ/RimL family protein N-acetyltransferase